MERNGSGGGGCCIARYTQSPNYYSPYDLSKMDRIMLRYRPIAPKPVSGSGPTGSPPSLNDDVKSGSRGKRRNTGGNNNNNGSNSNSNNNKRRKSSSSSSSSSTSSRSEGDHTRHVERVTLPLLPESPDLRSNHGRPMKGAVGGPMWLSFEQEVVGASVVVEGVTDTWLDGSGLGRTDEERRRRLEEDDTCPGFVSDGWNRVWWTNGAFRRMVAAERAAEVAVAVRLGMKEKAELPAAVGMFPAFTCRVRVEYGTHTVMTVPCDVWRMDAGGFAWRLDIKAALSLGR